MSRTLRIAAGLFVVASLSASVGCQTQLAGMTLPTPHYLEHRPQYFPQEPDFPLQRELATMQAQNAAADAANAPLNAARVPAPVVPPVGR